MAVYAAEGMLSHARHVYGGVDEASQLCRTHGVHQWIIWDGAIYALMADCEDFGND